MYHWTVLILYYPFLIVNSGFFWGGGESRSMVSLYCILEWKLKTVEKCSSIIATLWNWFATLHLECCWWGWNYNSWKQGQEVRGETSLTGQSSQKSSGLLSFLSWSTMVQWLLKDMGSKPWGLLSVEAAFSLQVCVGLFRALWLPPTVQKKLNFNHKHP